MRLQPASFTSTPGTSRASAGWAGLVRRRLEAGRYEGARAPSAPSASCGSPDRGCLGRACHGSSPSREPWVLGPHTPPPPSAWGLLLLISDGLAISSLASIYFPHACNSFLVLNSLSFESLRGLLFSGPVSQRQERTVAKEMGCGVRLGGVQILAVLLTGSVALDKLLSARILSFPL